MMTKEPKSQWSFMAHILRVQRTRAAMGARTPKSKVVRDAWKYKT